MFRKIFTILAVLALGMFAAAPVWADDVHEGKVVSAKDGELRMTDSGGGNAHMHKVTASVAITRNGKEAQLNDLKQGDSIKVTTKKSGDKVEVVAIEANG